MDGGSSHKLVDSVSIPWPGHHKLSTLCMNTRWMQIRGAWNIAHTLIRVLASACAATHFFVSKLTCMGLCACPAQLVANMVEIQLKAKRPLTTEQQNIMKMHLQCLYATGQPSQQMLTQHSAALLRSFAAGSALPPLPGTGRAQAPRTGAMHLHVVIIVVCICMYAQACFHADVLAHVCMPAPVCKCV